ncbi:MAG: NAD(P)H-dependent flavin oxidoreductase [Ignavibacteriaceae bacterium]
MNAKNRITELFRIKYPIIQAGMVWVSGWKLVSAVSNSGGLGLIGAGSMKPDLLAAHLDKCHKATKFSFGVNLPLLRKDADDLLDVIIDKQIKIVFTSAGNPAKHIGRLKNHNIKVVHVVSSLKQGKKAEAAGCDAVVGEGVEAGGHNGSDELTTLTLIPLLKDNLSVPVIAAGGIADGRQIAAAFLLGAEGVQIGTLFAASAQSSADVNYKQAIVKAGDSDTTLSFRKIGLVRMLKNHFSSRVSEAEGAGADSERLIHLLGEKREMKGIFEGDTNEGMMEAGQSAAFVDGIYPVEIIFKRLLQEFKKSLEVMDNIRLVFPDFD